MRPTVTRFLSILALALMMGTALPAAAWAQAVGKPSGQRAKFQVGDQRAEEVRNDFRMVLDRYPPTLGRVLKLDPSLMADKAYLASYPPVAEYLGDHPEIARNPDYYLNFVHESSGQPQTQPLDGQGQIRMRALNMWQDMMTGFIVFLVFVTGLFALSWIVRYVVTHRRWLRVNKTQTDVHTRLLERFTTNDELLAYVQSPAGSAFLKATPLSADIASSPSLTAPLSRILWSVQAGLVLGAAGAGLLVIKHYVFEEVSEVFMVLGTLAISLGAGFALAALASYALSRRLGLLDSPVPRSDSAA